MVHAATVEASAEAATADVRYTAVRKAAPTLSLTPRNARGRVV